MFFFFNYHKITNYLSWMRKYWYRFVKCILKDHFWYFFYSVSCAISSTIEFNVFVMIMSIHSFFSVFRQGTAYEWSILLFGIVPIEQIFIHPFVFFMPLNDRLTFLCKFVKRKKRWYSVCVYKIEYINYIS